MEIEFFADPSCPWSWAAYLWLDEVAPRRQLRLHMRPFSLLLRDGTSQLSPLVRCAREQAHRALRVASVVPSDEARTAFYAAVTAPVYAAVAEGRPPVLDIAAALDVAGLTAELAANADDTALDAAIEAGMRGLAELLPVAEPTLQRIPVLVLHNADGPVACHGPLLDPVPRGRQAVQIWDALQQLLEFPGMHGVTRARPMQHSSALRAR